METTPQARRYHAVKRRLFFVTFAVTAGLLLLALMSGASSQLKSFAGRFSDNRFIINGLYSAIALLVIYGVHFPLRYFEGFVWEHRFKLSRQRFAHWWFDDIKGACITGSILMITVGVVYALLYAFPAYWWVGAGVFWLFLTLALARLTPQVLIPLFFKYAPVRDNRLRERILALFKKAGVPVTDAYVVDFSRKTKKANAFVCGVGKNRRVVLSDTLAEGFSIPEVEAVVAHEIGHYAHRDIIKLATVNSFIVLVGFYFVDFALRYAAPVFGASRIDDIALLPMGTLALIAFSFIATPALNAYSRRLEVQADDFSIRLTGAPGEFIAMMRKLGSTNLSECEPGFWAELFFYDHPPLSKRIRRAAHWDCAGP